jgi:hypothetical protein
MNSISVLRVIQEQTGTNLNNVGKRYATREELSIRKTVRDALPLASITSGDKATSRPRSLLK